MQCELTLCRLYHGEVRRVESGGASQSRRNRQLVALSSVRIARFVPSLASSAHGLHFARVDDQVFKVRSPPLFSR